MTEVSAVIIFLLELNSREDATSAFEAFNLDTHCMSSFWDVSSAMFKYM
jgi:hypothetical protein